MHYLLCNKGQDSKSEANEFGLLDEKFIPGYEKKFAEIEGKLSQNDPLRFHFLIAKRHISWKELTRSEHVAKGSYFFDCVFEKYKIDDVLKQEIFPWETVIFSVALNLLSPEDLRPGYRRLALKIKDVLEDIITTDKNQGSFLKYQKNFIRNGLSGLTHYLSRTHQPFEVLSANKIRAKMPPQIYGEPTFASSAFQRYEDVEILLEIDDVEGAKEIAKKLTKDSKKALKSTSRSFLSQEKYFISWALYAIDIAISLKENPQTLPESWQLLKKDYEKWLEDPSFQKSSQETQIKNYLNGVGNWSVLPALSLDGKAEKVHEEVDAEINTFKHFFGSNGQIPLHLQRNPYFIDCYFLKAQAYQAEGKTPDAIRLLMQLNQNPQALRQLSEIYEKLEVLSKAFEYAQKAYHLSKSKQNYEQLKRIKTAKERESWNLLIQKEFEEQKTIFEEQKTIELKGEENPQSIPVNQDYASKLPQDHSKEWLFYLKKIKGRKELPKDFDPYPFWAESKNDKELYVASLINMAFFVSQLEDKIPSRSEGNTLYKWLNRARESYNKLSKGDQTELYQKNKQYIGVCEDLLTREPKGNIPQENFIPDDEDTKKYPVLLDSFKKGRDVILKIQDKDKLSNSEFQSFLEPYATKGNHWKCSFYLVKQKDETFQVFNAKDLPEKDKGSAIELNYNYAPYHHPKGPGDPVLSYKIDQFKDNIMFQMGLYNPY